MKRLLAAFAVLTSIASGGCGSDRIAGPGQFVSRAGALELRISIPQPGASALLLEIGGGPVDSLSSDLEAVMLTTDPTHRVIVRGPLKDAATVRLWVPDVTLRSHYVGSVIQAVDERYNQLETAGYRVQIRAR